MMLKVETFKGHASVSMHVNLDNLMITVKKYSYGGNLLEKVACDTRPAAEGYFKQWRDEIAEDERDE